MPIDPEEKEALEAIRASLHNMLSSVQAVVLRIERYLIRRQKKESSAGSAEDSR